MHLRLQIRAVIVTWLAAVIALAMSVMTKGNVLAQSATASGSVGAGVINDQAVASVGAHVEIGNEQIDIGLGAVVRFVGGSLRDADWDEPSDFGRILRYALFNRKLSDSLAVAIAAGQLNHVSLGHGSLLHDYAGGLDFDRGRLGIDVRLGGDALTSHGFIDNLIDPQLAGLHVQMAAQSGIDVGATIVGDRATDVSSRDPMKTTSQAAWAGLDVSIAIDRKWFRARPYVDVASRFDGGSGVHLGLRVGTSPHQSSNQDWISSTHAELAIEARHGTDQYVPGFIGPLYLRDREQFGDTINDSLAEVANRGGLGGTSWRIEVNVSPPSVGSLRASLATRPGLPSLTTLFASAPSFREIQFGGWAVIEGRSVAALAIETRLPLRGRWFAAATGARRYIRSDGVRENSLIGIWLASLSLGAQLGEHARQ